MAAVESRELPADTERQQWERSAVDLANLVVGFMVLAGVIATAVLLEEATKGISQDIVGLFDGLPEVIGDLVLGVIQLLMLAAPVALAVSLAWRRMWRCLGVLVAAGALGAIVGALTFSSIDDIVPADTVSATLADSFITGAAFPSPTYMAAAAAVATAAAPWLTRRYRRAAWIALIVLGIARITTSTTVPTTVAGMLAAGFLAGSLVLLVLGSPVRRPRRNQVAQAVRAAGVELTALEPLELGANHSYTFVGTRPDETQVFVKAVDPDRRDADMLFRTMRVMRVKGLEDEHPNSSTAQTVERAALAALLARQAGARAPRVEAVGETQEAATVQVTEFVDGRRLSDLSAEDASEELLDDLWNQVAALGRQRIAHRWLNGHHVLVPTERAPVIIDYRWSILGANDAALGADVAELLCATAMVVGPERAVAAADRNLERDALARALPVLQPLALSRDTRAALREKPGVLDGVRDGVQEATGTEADLADLRRVTAWTLLTWVGFFVLASFVLAIASNLTEIGDAFSIIQWGYVPLIIVLVLLTYAAGALLLAGAASVRLPFLLTWWMMHAQSFLNRFTPANSGGMAMRVRYLQRNGEDLGGGASTIGLTTLAGGIMHWAMLLAFVLAAGQADETEFDAPDVNLVAIIILGIGVVAGVVFFTTWGRRAIVPWIKRALKTVREQLRTIGSSPGRLAAVFGGATLQKLLLVVAWYVTLVAFGIDMSFVRASSLYLVATTIGAAVPTPGGVGGVEAALTAALTGAGIDDGAAFSIVLIFRLFSYWLPVPIGWVAMKDMQRRDLV